MHSSDLLMYYKHLVARCGDDTNFVATQGELAKSYGTTVRSVQRYDAHLEALNLIWRRKVGRSYRRTITYYEPEPCSEPTDEQFAEVIARDDPAALLDAAASAITAGDEQRAQALAWQAAMARAQVQQRADSPPEAVGDSVVEPVTEAFFSPPNDDRSVTLSTTDRSGTAFKDSDSLIRHPASAVCRPHGDGGKHLHRRIAKHPHMEIPDTEATQLLRALGCKSRVGISKHSAAPLDRIWRAERRRAELDAEPGMIIHILDEDGVVWTSGGKHVDNSATVPLDDADAGHTKYIGGALGRYIRTGLDEPPPGDDVPVPTEPERYRRDAEHAMIDGWVPPTLRPLPAPPEAPPDDPAVDKYGRYGRLPQWDEGDTP